MCRLLFQTLNELEQTVNDSKAAAIDILIGTVILNAIDKGCVKRLNFLLRFASLAKRSIEKSAQVNCAPPTLRRVENPYSVEMWNAGEQKFDVFTAPTSDEPAL